MNRVYAPGLTSKLTRLNLPAAGKPATCPLRAATQSWCPTAAWLRGLKIRDLRRTDRQAADKIEAAVDVLAEYGPTLGRPLAGTLTGSKLANPKELRRRQTNIRVLFVFDPWRSAILLVAGDKTGQWHKWYEEAIPQAEQLFALYLEERGKAEEEGRE